MKQVLRKQVLRIDTYAQFSQVGKSENKQNPNTGMSKSSLCKEEITVVTKSCLRGVSLYPVIMVLNETLKPGSSDKYF